MKGDVLGVLVVLIVGAVLIAAINALFGRPFWSTVAAALVYMPTLAVCVIAGIFIGGSIGQRWNADVGGTIVGALVGLLILFPIIGGLIRRALF